MTSTTTMITLLEGCLDTPDLTPWEQDFVRDLARLRDSGQVTKLTEKQIDILERLHKRHFAGAGDK